MFEDTLSMLEDRKGQWRQIADACGLEYSWITKLAQGKIKNPGIKNLEILHTHLLSRYKRQV